MSIELYNREEAVRRFNDLVPGHDWLPDDMAIHDVFFTGWPEGEVPERLWLPTRGLPLMQAAALIHAVAESHVLTVRRLSTAAQASLEEAREAGKWRCYGPEG
jgi:hypothetical protein